MFVENSYNPVIKTLDRLYKNFSHVEKVIGIYYDTDVKGIQIYCSDGSKPDIAKHFMAIQKLRTEEKSPKWLGVTEIFFEKASHEKTDNDIFSELNNKILFFRLNNKWDKENDLIYIYYNIEALDADKKLSTENKSIISRLITESVKSILESEMELYSRINDFKERDDKIIDTLNKKKEEIVQYEERQLAYVDHILEKIKKEQKITVFLSDEAKKKIREYKGGIHLIETELSKAAVLAKSTSVPPVNSVKLHDYNITLENIIPCIDHNTAGHRIKTERQVSSESRKSKTFKFLERLEGAIRITLDRKEKITGANVGSNFSPSITAPAISDALKKHRERIINLMKEYPDRWLMARNYFRPVQNILLDKDDKE